MFVLPGAGRGPVMEVTGGAPAWRASLRGAAMIASRNESASKLPRSGGMDRRQFDRFDGEVPDWIGKRVGTADEVARLKASLAFNARQMAQLRSRNEQLMAVNSDLRCKLGEMTLRWVDASDRPGR
jgi:hypothetical protein